MAEVNPIHHKKIAIVIPAAGFGRRMGGKIAKQFIEVGGKSILAHTIEKFQTWAKEYRYRTVILIPLSEGMGLPKNVVGDNIFPCLGGKERADSVANALETLEGLEKLGGLENVDWVMVHDAARPLVAVSDIEKLYQVVKNDAVGGILAEKITSTVKRVQAGQITETVCREDLWLAQTPQCFRFELLKQSLAGNRSQLTDESSGIEAMGLSPKIIQGSRENIKITTPEDLNYFINKIQQAEDKS